jgi:hypothetical protein
VASRPPSGLCDAARVAWREAVALVGEGEYPGAVARYARAVDVVYRARAEWVKGGRQIVARNPNGASGIHPLLKAMLDWERASADRAAELGLTPASAKRIGLQRGRGRPLGANSAPDRVALPAPQWRDGEPAVLTLARPGLVMRNGDADAVNRARGHAVDE